MPNEKGACFSQGCPLGTILGFVFGWGLFSHVGCRTGYLWLHGWLPVRLLGLLTLGLPYGVYHTVYRCVHWVGLFETVGLAVLGQLELIYEFERVDYRVVVVLSEGVEIGEAMSEESILDGFISTGDVELGLSALFEGESEGNEASTLVVGMDGLFEQGVHHGGGVGLDYDDVFEPECPEEEPEVLVSDDSTVSDLLLHEEVCDSVVVGCERFEEECAGIG